MSGLLVSFVSAFVGALGFGLLLHAPRKALLWASLIGALGYCCYWLLLRAGLGENFAVFFGALLSAACAQIAARRTRMIATIFVTVAILPFVPGLGLYRAMRSLAQGELAQGLGIAFSTMSSILMIALGIGLGSFFFGLNRHPKKGGQKMQPVPETEKTTPRQER